jgi:3-phosphoshikimate 1-carboxyvinyltransferase
VGAFRGFSDPWPVVPLGFALDAEVIVPGSKSLTNRAVLVAAAASGTTVLRGVLASDDTEAMIDVVRAVGVTVVHDERAATAVITGIDGAPSVDDDRGDVVVDVRRSGTTARFVVPFLAAGHGQFVVDGHEQMRARPMGDLYRALDDLGVRTEALGGRGSLPVRLHSEGLAGGAVQVPGSVSSQFLSGLLLAAPLATSTTVIDVIGDLVSVPYVRLTLSVMRAFGAVVDHGDFSRIVVEPTGYVSPGEFAIEPDASGASYFFAAAVATGGRVRVPGLGSGAEQGDVRFADILGALGATVHRTNEALEVVAAGPLRGGVVDMGDCSDTAQTLAAIAPLAMGPITVTGIGFIRRKETDRIAAVVAELRRLGVEATEDPDGFTIVPGRIRAAVVETYDDHRMAMSFTVLGLVEPGVSIADPGCVAKTFPSFFDVVESLRADHLRAEEMNRTS